MLDATVGSDDGKSSCGGRRLEGVRRGVGEADLLAAIA